MFINFTLVPILSHLISKSFISYNKASLYTALASFVGELILDLTYVYDLLTTPISYKEDEYITHSYDLKDTKTVYSPINNEVYHIKNDTLVVYESGKYTYDYTYDNPLVLSEGYDSSNYKSSYI